MSTSWSSQWTSRWVSPESGHTLPQSPPVCAGTRLDPAAAVSWPPAARLGFLTALRADPAPLSKETEGKEITYGWFSAQKVAWTDDFVSPCTSVPGLGLRAEWMREDSILNTAYKYITVQAYISHIEQTLHVESVLPSQVKDRESIRASFYLWFVSHTPPDSPFPFEVFHVMSCSPLWCSAPVDLFTVTHSLRWSRKGFVLLHKETILIPVSMYWRFCSFAKQVIFPL